MYSFRTFVAALTLAAGLLNSPSLGQSLEEGDEKPPAATIVDQNGGSLDADQTPVHGPDIFLLPDKDGTLRRVLGYRYEDFFKAWQNDGAADDGARKPAYAISSLNIDATAKNDIVDISIRVEVELHNDGWIEVPLHLASLILEDSRIEGGASRDFLTVDAATNRYVLWARGKPSEIRTVTLKGQAPIRRNAEAQSLELDLPVAQKSTIDFVAPGEIEVEPESAVTASASSGDGVTRSRIDGAKGLVTLSWGQLASEAHHRMAEFEATADAQVQVEQGRLSYESIITLTGLREPIERVRLKLPAGAILSPPKESGYAVELNGDDGPEEGSEVEIRFDEPTATPPPLRLTAVQTSPAGDATPLTIGAFEVLGAFRQRGVLAIRVSEQVHAHFEQTGRVRQIEPADVPPALSSEKTLAAFETSGVDWAVEVHTQPRKRQITVKPEYQLHLGSQGAELEVALNYQVSGGRLFEARVNLRGWELTEQPIESGGIVNSAELHVADDQMLILPLKESGAQQVQIRFTLRREAGLGVHDLPLPEAMGAFVLPGDLTVVCDPQWRASAQIDKSVGVSPIDLRMETPTAIASQTLVGESNVPPLRLQAFLPQARLVIDVSERDQLIRVHSAVTARVERQSFRAEQRLEYEILYQPATQLAATVSADLLANEGLELLLDGKPLTSTTVDIEPLSAPATGEADGNLRLVVRLPQPTQGRVRLSIRSHLPLDEAQRTGNSPITLPLALPDQQGRSTALVESAYDGVRVALASGGLNTWRPSATGDAKVPPPAASTALELVASKPVAALAIRLEPASVGAPVRTRVEAAWVQTWIAGGMRQDRLVYRFHTSGGQIEVQLPPQYEGVEVLLDGALASIDRTASGTISVEIPDAESGQLHTLELRRHTALQIGSWGKQRVAFPRIAGADSWSPFFWQLILPPDLSALATPEGMSAEYRLGWHGLRWGREPTQSQRDLEQWTGATTAPTPGPRTTQYVFSSFEPPSTAEFIAVRRIWLVIAAGIGVFAVGLAWLYTSMARSAAFWLALCVAAGGLLFVYPEAVVLLVQAVILGGAFTIISAVTQWLLAGSEPRRAATSPTSSSVGSLTATQPWVAEPPANESMPAPSGSTLQPSGSAS